MTGEHSKTIGQTESLANSNPDICVAVTNMCRAWSNDTCDNLIGTYEYLENNAPSELEMFMSGLAYMVRVSPKGGDE